ncbi:MAG: AAA family ATPase, partial [Actinomycetota bacterium]
MGGVPTVGAAPRAAVVQRRRLVDRLAARFDARLTLVTGGGGSGKTTALAQAMAADSDHADVWYPCTPADRDASTLLAGLAAATYRAIGGADPSSPDAPEPIDAIHDAVLAASPRHVCLVLDDVQLFDDPTAVDALLFRLPSNGHLLLAGRRRPGLPTARLDAAGALVELTQDDLLLTDDELIEFANLRGVDIEILRAAERWPAFVELASSGIEVRSRRYLEEEALAGLDVERRRALARFAAVGGGDDALAQAVTGWSLPQLVHDLPLVRWSGEVAQLHDLWRDLLATEITDGDRRSAAAAATGVLRAAGDVDRAIEIGAAVGAWDDVAESVSVAVRAGVDGGIRSDQLQRWRSLLPVEYSDAGVAVLIDALLERERDPTSVEAERLFDRAAQRFDEDGDDSLQLASLAQLGYLARVRADVPGIDAVMDRVRAIADRYPPAAPFLEFGAAWKALNTARPDLQLAAMERIV